MSKRAFTLAEVMVAMAIVVIPMMALLSAHIYSLRATVKDEYRVTATNIAYSELSRIEEVLRQDFTVDVSRARSPVTGFAGYEMEVTEALTRSDLKTPRVTVYWSDKQGPHQYELWTHIVETL